MAAALLVPRLQYLRVLCTALRAVTLIICLSLFSRIKATQGQGLLSVLCIDISPVNEALKL